MPKQSTKRDKNLKDPSKAKTLEQLKQSINKKFDDIEHSFYQIGLDLMKVNMYVKNFRKWVRENTTMGVSTAYMLMQLVRRDQEMRKSKNYKTIKAKISFYKLVKLLKYPSDFVDKLDFTKMYDVPGGKKFNLLDMPRELFTEVISHEYKMLTAKERGEDDGLSEVPMDEVVISKAKDKLDKLLQELQNVVTVLSEVHVSSKSKDTIGTTIEELESISSQARHICEVGDRLLSSLKKQFRAAKAA